MQNSVHKIPKKAFSATIWTTKGHDSCYKISGEVCSVSWCQPLEDFTLVVGRVFSKTSLVFLFIHWTKLKLSDGKTGLRKLIDRQKDRWTPSSQRYFCYIGYKWTHWLFLFTNCFLHAILCLCTINIPCELTFIITLFPLQLLWVHSFFPLLHANILMSLYLC